jgi:hypothetical protein
MQVEGGHAVPVLWADTAARMFFGQNSWSNRWGGPAPAGAAYRERGYFGLPFAYVERGEADDIWAFALEDAPAG